AARSGARRLSLERLEARDCPAGGALDLTFGGTGTLALPNTIASRVNAVAVQPDGKIVAVGSLSSPGSGAMSVIRMNPDGSLDTTFHGSRTLTIKVAKGAGGGKPYSTGGDCVALQPDGKIVVGGSALVTTSPWSSFYNDTEYVVARINPDGSLDTTFGNSKGSGLWVYNPTGSR